VLVFYSSVVTEGSIDALVIWFLFVVAGEWMIPAEKEKKADTVEPDDSGEPKGDPEMAPVYLRRLLPVFCNTFQSTMLASVR